METTKCDNDTVMDNVLQQWKGQNTSEETKAVYFFLMGLQNKFVIDHDLETAKLRQTYDWVTKVTIELRLSYENRFGPFKKRKQVTIDLRKPFWALQKTQKNYDWLTIEL